MKDVRDIGGTPPIDPFDETLRALPRWAIPAWLAITFASSLAFVGASWIGDAPFDETRDPVAITSVDRAHADCAASHSPNESSDTASGLDPRTSGSRWRTCGSGASPP